MNATNNVNVQALQAEINALKEKLKEAKKTTTKVTLSVAPTSKGSVGFKICGLGIPKFFYKQHALMLFGESEESKKLREEIVAWVLSKPELTEKQ